MCFTWFPFWVDFCCFSVCLNFLDWFGLCVVVAWVGFVTVSFGLRVTCSVGLVVTVDLDLVCSGFWICCEFVICELWSWAICFGFAVVNDFDASVCVLGLLLVGVSVYVCDVSVAFFELRWFWYLITRRIWTLGVCLDI